MFKENTAHNQQDLFDSSTWLNAKIKKKLQESWAPLFYELVFCHVSEKLFSSLYCSDNGRPNIPVNVLLCLEFIKHMKDYTDEELLDQFYFNYQVSYALGIRNLGDLYIAPRTLYEFREKVVEYTKEHPDEADLVFKQFELLTENFIKVAKLKTGDQRSDSTQIIPNIKKAGRLSLAFDVLLNAVKAFPVDAVPEFLKHVPEPGFRTKILFTSKGSETKTRLGEVLTLSFRLLQYTRDIPALDELPEIQLLKRFMKEQTTGDDALISFVAKENKDISSTSLQSAYDEDATYRKKGNKENSGYVLNITETCAEENPVQLITDYTLEKNIKTDIDMLKSRLPIIIENTGVKEIYVDGGYYDEELVLYARSLGVTLHFTNMTGRKTDSSKLPLTSFIRENDQRVVSCPAGHAPYASHLDKRHEAINSHFDRERCQSCPLKQACRVKIGKRRASLRLPLKSLHAAEAREKIATKAIRRETTSKRAAIEGTNSSLKRSQGADKLSVRGIIKSTIVVGMKIIGNNFKRIKNYFASLPKIRVEIKDSLGLQGRDLYFSGVGNLN
jgi:hypothetical protein